jgi:pyridoxamine 5'-phosphate oxidase
MRRVERTFLFDTPAGFDDPLEMLLGCHRRIEKQLHTLKRLRAHLASRGVDAEAAAAAQSILTYFIKAAPKHHQDEELDLFPLLEARITDPEEAARFRALRRGLESDHRLLEVAWAQMRRPLEVIADGLPRTLPAAHTQDFTSAYARHIATEEAAFKMLFDRWLKPNDIADLGRSMAARRKHLPRAL